VSGGLVGHEGILIGVECDFATFVPGPPAALVAGLVESYAVNPSAERGITVEATNATVNFDEDFLGDVGGIGGVMQTAGDKGVDGLMELGDELVEGFLGPGLQRGDEEGV